MHQEEIGVKGAKVGAKALNTGSIEAGAKILSGMISAEQFHPTSAEKVIHECRFVFEQFVEGIRIPRY